jgi:lysophospholipase L1-like esterase
MITACGPARSAGPSTPAAPATPSPTSTLSASPQAATLPTPLRVVGIGDSVTAAFHCDCKGFISDYGELLEARYDVNVDADELGVSGATTSSILPSLHGDGLTAIALGSADVISVTIGANDLNGARDRYDDHTCGGSRDLDCFVPAVEAMKDGLNRDLAAIHVLVGERPVQILVNDYWNVFEDGAVALREDGRQYLSDSDTMTREANIAICAAATAAGATCVDTYTPYKGADGSEDPTALLASDGNHPDPAGHEAIAKAMLAAGLPALLGPA